MTAKEFEPFARLGNQVIITAVQDYENYHAELLHCKKIKDKKKIDELKVNIKQIEKFVDSELYEIYTKLPRDAVRRRLKQIRHKYSECYKHKEKKI